MGLCRKYVVQQLAARLRPQLEAVVKQNESAAGDTFVPGDFDQVQISSCLRMSHRMYIGTALNPTKGRRAWYSMLAYAVALLKPCILSSPESLLWSRNHVGV